MNHRLRIEYLDNNIDIENFNNNCEIIADDYHQFHVYINIKTTKE